MVWRLPSFSLYFHRKTEDSQKPQCMLCEIVVSNANLMPSKMQKHFDKQHDGSNVEDHDETFKHQRKGWRSSRFSITIADRRTINKGMQNSHCNVIQHANFCMLFYLISSNQIKMHNIVWETSNVFYVKFYNHEVISCFARLGERGPHQTPCVFQSDDSKPGVGNLRPG